LMTSTGTRTHLGATLLVSLNCGPDEASMAWAPRIHSFG
jgi:hypothetical protein